MHEARRMWRRGGVTPFLFGLRSRVARDVVFGALYSGLRERGRRKVPRGWNPTAWGLFVNAAAGVTATIVSGPLNYVQNMQYATSSKKQQMTIPAALRKLVTDTQCQKGGIAGKLSFLQQRLRIGE